MLVFLEHLDFILKISFCPPGGSKTLFLRRKSLHFTPLWIHDVAPRITADSTSSSGKTWIGFRRSKLSLLLNSQPIRRLPKVEISQIIWRGFFQTSVTLKRWRFVDQSAESQSWSPNPSGWRDDPHVQVWELPGIRGQMLLRSEESFQFQFYSLWFQQSSRFLLAC